ncbi:family 20 glycosylhydrolase [candidate division KSB1 bacterium]|nr:family 20 glycosylhydrolase [candidate division KSB1 bacterium]
MNLRLFAIYLMALFLSLSCAKRPVTYEEATQTVIDIIPKPQQLDVLPAFFTMNKETKIVVPTQDDRLIEIARYLNTLIHRSTAWELEISASPEPASANRILFILDDVYRAGAEAYELHMTSQEITIKASAPNGIFYGVQSLRQLLPPSIERENGLLGEESIDLRCVHIVDEPRFKWRGVMLDVSRHFFDVDYIKRLIDHLAYHKLNTFHWHLCDDQGWRIEIKQYPKLTTVGAWRVDRENYHWHARPPQIPGEEATYGGFYTQDEVRDVVKYASQRFITIVPEIEMPAHTSAALAAYPEYSCTGGPFTVPPGSIWPITDIYCAGNDSTFEFLQNILKEFMDLFPGEYIHIGGDEATKTNWETCKKCQARIEAEGLKDEFELQSYFVRRMENFIHANHRRLIGWDEILEGGLAPRACVMSWRGMEGGIEAAKIGHDVVMSPVSHCYFNMYQGPMDQEPFAYGGYIPIRMVYEFEPIPEELNAKEAAHILGAQANLWTEFVSTPETAEYLFIPRMDALAEVLWTQKEKRDWNDFSRRLLHQFDRYDQWGINYARSALAVNIDTEVDVESKTLLLSLRSEIPQVDIRYTLDENDPTINSMKYRVPIEIDADVHFSTASFIDSVRVSPVLRKTFEFHLATGKKVELIHPNESKYDGGGDYSLTNSLLGSINYMDGRWKGFHEFDFIATLDLEKIQQINYIGVGFLRDPMKWIFLPKSVEFAISEDGKTFESIKSTELPEVKPEDQVQTVEMSAELASKKARFIRIHAQNIGRCPEWHTGAGGPAWVFVDEIVVK